MLALRRVGEATLLRDSDKVSELMNFHRRSDTPLGPPVCLRLADRMGAVGMPFGLAVHSGRGTKRGLCGTITLVNELAVWFTQAGMEVDDMFGYDWGARASRVLVSASRRNELLTSNTTTRPAVQSAVLLR